MTTPTALVEAVSRFRNEVRIVDYVTVPRSAVTAPAPTDDELAKWYETNKATFEAPEVRSLSRRRADARHPRRRFGRLGR